MKKHLPKISFLFILATLLLPSLASAAGGGGASIVLVADTRNLPAFEAWWANLYNESHLWFTVVTCVMIPVVGVIFGTIADLIMGMIGIDLKSRELAEH